MIKRSFLNNKKISNKQNDILEMEAKCQIEKLTKIIKN